MKGLMATAIFMILTVVAVAKPAPVSDLNPSEDRTPALARNDADINIGSAGATLERNYFQAPQIAVRRWWAPLPIAVSHFR